MIEKQLVANNPYIHARPTSVIVNEACKFKTKIYFADGDTQVDAKNMLSMIGFLAHPNRQTVSVKAEGKDDTEVFAALDAMEKAYLDACVSQFEAELSSIKNALLPDAEPEKVEAVRKYLMKSYNSKHFADLIEEINAKYKTFAEARKKLAD